MIRLLRDLVAWPRRRWIVAAATAAATVLIIGIPTRLIANPVFSREVPVTGWAWPVLIVTAALAGLVTATYVRSPLAAERADRAGRWGTVGGVLGFFAVGCPVCNKLVLLALGTSGALRFFQPVQPLLAVASVVMLGWALVIRVRRENSCGIRQGGDAAPVEATTGSGAT